MDGRNRVAQNLRRLRIAQGLSQEALAVDAGVDRSYISGIEQKSFNPTVDILDRLAKAPGIDVSELMARVEGTEIPAGLTSGRKRGS